MDARLRILAGGDIISSVRSKQNFPLENLRRADVSSASLFHGGSGADETSALRTPAIPTIISIRRVDIIDLVRMSRYYCSQKNAFVRMNKNVIFLSLLIVQLVMVASAHGRAKAAKSYDKMVAESDVVCIIEPIESGPVGDNYVGHMYGFSPKDFVATNTRFRIHAFLKGGELEAKEITVLHVSYSKDVGGSRKWRLLHQFSHRASSISKKSAKG